MNIKRWIILKLFGTKNFLGPDDIYVNENGDTLPIPRSDTKFASLTTDQKLLVLNERITSFERMIVGEMQEFKKMVIAQLKKEHL